MSSLRVYLVVVSVVIAGYIFSFSETTS
jgi:hypothetical protein